MEAREYTIALDRLNRFEGPPYFEAKAELFRAMARHRQESYADAVAHYERFLTRHLSDMPPKDRAYVEEYAKFFLSRAKAKLDSATPLYSSLEELRKLSASAPFLTRNEFAL
ncbi:MAG: hypothetical protein KJN60_10800 [Boseongicola sp.]|nr:hypothetical protein [Boseongicola sp.]